MNQSKEANIINDIVRVSKIGISELYSEVIPPKDKKPQSSVGIKKMPIPNPEPIDRNLDSIITMHSKSIKFATKGNGDEIPLRINAQFSMDKIKEIEDHWEFEERFQRRFIPSNESCPKGGPSFVFPDRYCDFLDFPCTPRARKNSKGEKPRRVNDKDPLFGNRNIQIGGNGSVEKTNIQSLTQLTNRLGMTATANIVKGKHLQGKASNSAAVNSRVKSKITKKGTSKVKKAIPKNSEGEHPQVSSTVGNSGAESVQHLPYIITHFDLDGSIRYVENDGFSSDIEQCEKTLKIVKVKSTKRIETPKIVTRKKKASPAPVLMKKRVVTVKTKKKGSKISSTTNNVGVIK